MSTPEHESDPWRRQPGEWVDTAHRRAEWVRLSARERRIIADLGDALAHDDPEFISLFWPPGAALRDPALPESAPASEPSPRRGFGHIRRLFHRR